jgi:beta-glucosidase-like glycosyl hydrolase
VLWVSDPRQINRLQHIAVDQSRLHIPILFGLDVIHGYHTIFPAPLALASSWDPKLVEAVQGVAAREARVSGIAWTFAPMLDIARDARAGRMVGGSGEDPYLGAAIARAQVLGFQGTEPGAPDRALACAKHFAGYGAADGGRDYDSSYIPEEQMWNTYLPPFEAAADAGVAAFMSAYMDLNDVPASANRWLLHDVLREDWRYNGFVVSFPMVPIKEQPKQTREEAQNALSQAIKVARRNDVALLALGEIALMSGEAAARASLRLSGGQQELLEAVVATGKPVVLVLVNGRPLDISWAAEHVPAILETWYSGSQAGNGIADLLFGVANPGGHLPVSWLRKRVDEGFVSDRMWCRENRT